VKVLVFGKTGQVARAISARAPEDVTVRALGRDEADLADPAACARLVETADADVIINAAAYTNVDRAEAEEVLADAVNAAAPAAMARAAARRGLPFLHISTEFVFDGSGDAPWAPQSPTGPLGAYGRTKRKGELGVISAQGAYAVLRTSWVFSDRGVNFVNKVLQLAREKNRLSIVCDQIGGPTAAPDIADALLAMARQFHAGNAKPGVYHFAGQPDISRAEFARHILRKAGLDAVVEDIPTSRFVTPARRPLNSRLDCDSFTWQFGIYRPDWSLFISDVLKYPGG
jgi:dTDP-4-dehydrorhamnose reductase